MRLIASLAIVVLIILSACTARAAQTNDYIDKARQIFEELLERTPDDPDVYKYLGDIYAAEGDSKKSAEFFEKYSQMRPQDYYGWYKQGEIAWARGDRKKAKRFFEKALDLQGEQKGDLQVQIARARMMALIGDRSGSDELFEQLLKQNAASPDVAGTWVDTLIDTDRMKEARLEADRYAKEFPDDYSLQRSRVRTFILSREYGEASSALEPLMEKYPDDAGLAADRAELLYGQGDWYEARPLYEKLAEGSPENLDFKSTLDDIFMEHNPRLMGGMDFLLNGEDRRYGPFFTYVHPIDSQWAFELGYKLDYNSSNVVGYNPDYWTVTNTAPLLAYYKPYRTVELSVGCVNNMNGTTYQPAPVFSTDWNDPIVGHMRLDFIYNDLFDDPVAGLYFDGKQDTVGFTYDKTFIDRIIFSTGYSSVWYRVNGAKAGLGLGDEFGRNDITDTTLQFIILRRPQITLGYEFYYSKLHVVNDYLNIIPLIPESEQNNILYGFSYEWNKWLKTDFGGFVGNDSKRDLSISDLALYGFHISNRVKVSKRLELIGHYEYSSENVANTLGRYQFFGVDFLYRF